MARLALVARLALRQRALEDLPELLRLVSADLPALAPRLVSVGLLARVLRLVSVDLPEAVDSSTRLRFPAWVVEREWAEPAWEAARDEAWVDRPPVVA